METYLGTAGKCHEKEEDLRSPPGTAGERSDAHVGPGGTAGGITSPHWRCIKLLAQGSEPTLLAKVQKVAGLQQMFCSPRRKKRALKSQR